MPVYTLNPVADAYDSWSDAQIGYLADASDSNQFTLGTDGLKKYVGLDAPTSPTGKLVSVVAYFRTSTMTYSPYIPMQYALGVASRSGGTWTTRQLLALSGANTSVADSAAVAAAQGDVSLWGLTDIADAYIYAQWIASSGWVYLYKAWALAYYLPSATVAAPSAPIGTVATQTPEQTVTVSAVVESWQGAWLTGVSTELRIYLAADVTGSDPPTGVTPVWTETSHTTISTYIDGSTPTTLAVTATPGVDLEDEDYITFARVSRDLPAGRELDWSSWAKSASAWTVHVTPAAAPTTVSATADDEDGYVLVTVTAPTSSNYDADSGLATVERSDDLGLTWERIYGMTDVPIVLGGGATAIGVDYMAPAGRADVQYRARISAVHTFSLRRYSSLWTVQANVTTQQVREGWNFAVLDDPTASWSAAPVLAPLAFTHARASQVFEPLDGSLAKVVSGPERGRRGTLTFHAGTVAERAAAVALLAQAGPIVMATGFGDTFFIAFVGESSWEVAGSAGAPITSVSIGYAETEPPE